MYLSEIPKRYNVVLVSMGQEYALNQEGNFEVLTPDNKRDMQNFDLVTANSLTSKVRYGVAGGRTLVEGDAFLLREAVLEWPVVRSDGKWYTMCPDQHVMYEVEVHLSHADKGYSLPDLNDQVIQINISDEDVNVRSTVFVKGKKIQSAVYAINGIAGNADGIYINTNNPVARFFKMTNRKR